MLPIVQRELQVAARSPRFYKWRFRTGIAVLLLSAGIIVSSRGGFQSVAAGRLFSVFCFLALLFCLFEGLRKTSDAISEEKRDGTLGLLFLTDLKGFDVILGKLVAATVRSFSALLAFVPVLAITLLLGGTTGGEFWRMVLVLCFSLLASLCLCLMISTFSRDKSIGASGWTLSALCLIPYLARPFALLPSSDFYSAASPFELLRLGSDAYYRRFPGPYWAGIGWLFGISILSLVIASLVVPRAWHDKPVANLRRKRLGGKLSPRRLKRRRAMLDRNPAMWLMSDPASQRNFRLFLALIALVAAAAVLTVRYFWPPAWGSVGREVYLVIAWIGCLAVALAATTHVARESSRNLAEARENGALELILSTPVKVNDIIKGQWLALRGDLIPASVVFLAFVLMNLFNSFFTQSGFGNAILLKLAGEAVIGVITVGWVGMWMALTSKTPGRAFFKTIILGATLPHLVCTPTLVNQIILLVVAMDKVQVQFRRFVAERFLQQTGFTLPPPENAPANSPPVLRLF